MNFDTKPPSCLTKRWYNGQRSQNMLSLRGGSCLENMENFKVEYNLSIVILEVEVMCTCFEVLCN